MIFNWMPWVFMFMLGSFASGLVIYWVANNTITFAQQYTIMRSQGVKPNVLGNILGPLKKPRRRTRACRRASAPSGATRSRATASRRSPRRRSPPGATMPWDRVWAIAHEAARVTPGARRLGALRQLQPRRQVLPS